MRRKALDHHSRAVPWKGVPLPLATGLGSNSGTDKMAFAHIRGSPGWLTVAQATSAATAASGGQGTVPHS